MTGTNEGSWLADGVKEIERVVSRAMIVEPKLINIPQEKKGTYGIVTPGPASTANAIDVRLAGPAWHNEVLLNPAELKKFIESMSGRDVEPDRGAIYIADESATYVYDFEDRRNRAVAPLVMSAPWRWLASPQHPMDQKAIVRVLRIMFDRCLPGDSNLISALRKVNWKTDGAFEGTVQRGKEGMSRQTLAEVQGIADFPEEFALRVNVFENYNSPVMVRVALEIQPDVQKFEIVPFPNQITEGLAKTLYELSADLAETQVPTFIGSVRPPAAD